MADANLFDKFDPDSGGADATPAPVAAPVTAPQPDSSKPEPTNVFDQFDPDKQPLGADDTSSVGTFARSAERNIIPAAGGLAGAGAGAEAGAGIGAGIGAAAGAPFAGIGAVPGAAVGGTIGAIVGGIAGGFGGSYAAQKAQDWGAQALPDDWKGPLGGTEAQQAADIKYHPTEDFLGGMVPYVLTLKPGGWTRAAGALPANATAFQRIVTSPITSHIFGGAIMGGMELGNEVASGQTPDWTHVAISTGMGVVFNEPNRVGVKLTEMGAGPTRAAAARLGLRAPEPEAAPATEQQPAATPAEPTAAPEPTVAQAADAKVMGPGITEDVFMGSHQQAPDAAMTAQDNARTEASLIGPNPEAPDINAVARRMEPDTFQRYDELAAQRADLQAHISSAETPINTAPVEQHLAAIDTEMRDMAPQIAAAYRRASDVTGSPTVEPEGVARETPSPTPESPSQAPGTPSEPSPAGPVAASTQQQAAAIAEDVTRQLIAAGRSPAEAQAAGQLIGQHYVTRAARMNGVLGSPQDLYNVEGASIRAAGQPAPPKAGRGGKTPAAVDPVKAKAAADKIGATNLVQHLLPTATDKEISDVLGGKLSEAQVAGLRQGAGVAPPTELAQNAPATPEGDMTRQALAEYLRNGGTVSGAGRELFQPTYHGSPHVFDRFSNDKMGTGEGNQAFGWGTYLASKKDVAQYYREKLSAQWRAGEDMNWGGKNVLDHYETAQNNMEYGKAGVLESIMLHQPKLEIKTRLQESLEEDPSDKQATQGLAYLETLPPEAFAPTGGRLYHVEGPEDSELLDWGKTLSAQPQAIKDALKGSGILKQFNDNKSDFSSPQDSRGAGKGSNLYSFLSWKLGGDEAASRKLAEIGIPGHKYPAGTIANVSGKGSNYVIYDDSRLNITNYEQGKRGSITFAEGRKPLIKLFQDANASTFLHESGHQWLEELMRDTAHPAASDQLKADGQTVRNWLGMEGDTIATRQHEKFARGFEQYMREGVAPSAGLARVFSQFKSWLTSIYQTIKGLGTPISDDIKSVFDRLIAEEPNRTVLAPEREEQPSLASLHEQDAADAHPAHAEPIGDRIVAERDRYVAQQPPEVQNELARADAERTAAEPGAEAGAGENGRPEVGGAGGQPEPEPTVGNGGGERSTVQPGGGQGVGQGTAVPAGAEPGTRGNDDAGLRSQRSEFDRNAGAVPAQPLAPSPGDLFGAKESPFLERAGNIRLDTLSNNEDVRQAIRDAADENNDFIGDRGAKASIGQIHDLAEAAGMEAAERLVENRVTGQAFNAVEVMMLRRLLIQSASDVSAIMKRVAATGSTDEDVMAYAQAKARHQLIQGTVAQATAEAGRALGAFRNITGMTGDLGQFIQQATGKTLFQLREEAKLGSSMETPQQVSKFMRDTQKRSLGRAIVEFVINNLISNPVTHATYAAGNGILLAQKMTLNTLAAASIGEVRAMMGYEGERVRFGEVPAMLKAAWKTLPAAVKGVGQTARSGTTVRLPGGDDGQFALPLQPGAEGAARPMVDLNATWHSLMADSFSLMQGIPNALTAYGGLLKAGGIKDAPLIGLRYSNTGQAPDITYRGVNVAPIGTAIRMPSRNTAAIHTLFNVLNYSVDIAQQAYRQAANEGLVGDAMASRVADLNQNPTPEMMDKARGRAYDMTLMGKAGDFMSRVAKVTNWEVDLPILGNTQPIKLIDPFVQIAGQMAKQGIGTQTPIGLISLVAPERSELGMDLAGRNGVPARDMAVAKMAVGTSIAMGFMSLAANKLMTGSGPSDPREAAMWRMAGYQPYSVRIGDTYYALHRLGPLGFLAGIGADMYESAASASKGDMQKAAGQFLFSFSQNFLSEGFLSGPSELIKAVQNPQRDGERYISNFLSMFVPYSQGMNQLARSLDPYQRQSRSIIDAIRAKVPGQSEQLEPRRDVFGQPIPNMGALGPTSIYTSQFNHDPVVQAMENLSIFPAPVERSIRNVQLTDQQYDDYARIAGIATKQRLNAIVNSQQFRQWDPTTQALVIRETVSQSREAARGMVMMKYPTIPQQATAAALARSRK